MTVSDWLDEIKYDLSKYGVRGLKFNAQDLFHGLLSRGGFWINYGEDHYSRDWDLLIVLDACRWDLFNEVVDEYEFIEEYDSFMSLASHSREWLHKEFMEGPEGAELLKAWWEIIQDPDNLEIFKQHYTMSDRSEISDTAYISWNVFTQMLDPDAFDEFIPVGRAAWGDDQQILDPRVITDKTIQVMRESDPNFTIAHYMQPHTPFRNSDGLEHHGSVWERIQRGEKDYHEAWDEYKQNLRWVLEDVKLLLENVDAEKVAITADHGNVIGEWGCYGHRPYVPIPAVKRVPWATATAVDRETYIPEVEDLGTIDDKAVDKRLEALGYK
jgi:hypothetical protein